MQRTDCACRATLVQFRFSAPTVAVTAVLSSFGLLTVLCKFCLRPAGEKGASARRYRALVALRTSAVRFNAIGTVRATGEIPDGSTAGYIFTFAQRKRATMGISCGRLNAPATRLRET